MPLVRWMSFGVFLCCRSEQDLVTQPPPPLDPTKASTVGTRFVAAFPDPIANQDHTIVITSQGITTVRVAQVDSHGGWAAAYDEDVTVLPGLTEIEVDEGPWVNEQDVLNPDWSTTGSAVIVDADDPIEVYALFDQPERLYTTDRAITRLLPYEELDTTYRVILPEATWEGPSELYYIVAAVEDDTNVVAEPVEEPYQLDAGQIARVAVDVGATGELWSWRVTADKPVAVFGGGVSWCDSQIDSVIWEQLPPVSRWGTEYLAMPMYSIEATDMRLVANERTLVQLDCGEPLILEAGEHRRVPIDVPTRITASTPVLVMIEAKREDCVTSDDGEALATVTPTALYRTRVEVEPQDLVIANLFAGAEFTTFAAVESGMPDLVADPEAFAPHVSSSATDTVSYFEIDERTAFEGERLRGIEYSVAPLEPAPDEQYWLHASWVDSTYATSLGYDCAGCVPDLMTPKSCP